MKTISLPDHIATLHAHEEAYRQSRGSDRRDIVAKIIDEITSHGKGKEKFKEEDMKDLGTVS